MNADERNLQMCTILRNDHNKRDGPMSILKVKRSSLQI